MPPDEQTHLIRGRQNVTTAEVPQRAGHREWAALVVVLLAAFMGQVNLFAVNMVAPSLQADLGADFGQLQWVIGGYVLAYATGMVVAGRVGDRAGRRRVFLAGTVAFTGASIGCAVCPSVEWLIAARVAQGLAAALLMPQVLALVRATFTEQHQRERAIGLYGTVIGLGVIGGLVAGGLLLELNPAGLGWRAAFLVNIPVGLMILAAGPTIVESRDPHPARLDLVGAALTAVALLTALVPLTVAGERANAVWAGTTLAAGVPAAAILVAHQRRIAARGGDPLWAPAVLAAPGMLRRLAVVVAFYSGNAALFFALTYHLQDQLDLNPVAASAAFLPLGIGFAATSALSHRAGNRPIQAGALLMMCGLLALATAPYAGAASTQPAIFAGAVAVCGLGQGLVVGPLVNQVLSLVPTQHAGAGSGVLNTTTQAGMALGVTAGGLAYNAAGITTTALLLATLALLVAILIPTHGCTRGATSMSG